ncbi:MAG: SDR family NAD(P)-dependent oxidoreductase [Acidimicrobiales bacterium]
MGMQPSDALLTDRVAIVTGAGQGIGAAVASTLANFGAHLAICDHNATTLEATAERVRATGRQVLAVCLDVRDRPAVDAMFESIASQFGRVDILVNNAGGTFFAPFDKVNAKGEMAIIAENFTSVTHFIRNSLPLMDERGGSIVNITSIEAHRAAPGVAVYAAMKAAQASLTKSLSLELAPRRIRINCMAPDMIHTEGSLELGEAMQAVSEDAWFLQPLPDDGTVDDAAAAVAYLAGDMSKFVTGSTLHLDGGNWASGGWKLLRRGTFVV